MSLDSNVSLPVASWSREGIAVSERQQIKIGDVTLESGVIIQDVIVAFETYGTFNGNNAILVEHALTGDSHVASHKHEQGENLGWWDPLIGAGRSVDTDSWFVVCANVLGGCQGTTGPSSVHPNDGLPWGSRWPRITARDQVVVEAALADALGIDRFACIIGGSMGGMRALEWALLYPSRVQSLLLLATSAQSSADQIGTQTAQIRAITNDVNWNNGDYYSLGDGDGPAAGLALARQIAHLTYRTHEELESRFGRNAQVDENPYGPEIVGRAAQAGRFAVQSYLDHHGHKLVRRFDAGSYVSLTDVMNTHDVSRGRGDLESVLGRISCPVVVAGITSDRLYPIEQQELLSRLIPTAQEIVRIDSLYGHDGFLIEVEQVGKLIASSLNQIQ